MRYTRPPLEEVDTTVAYNVDEEDEAWLTNNQHFGTNINFKKANETSNGAVVTEESATGEESSDDDFMLKKKPTLSLKMFEHMLDLLEKATGLETIVTLTQAERLIVANIPVILQIFGTSHTAGPTHSAIEQKQRKKNEITVRSVISEIYNYWVNKRSRLRKPLLRKYWPTTASNDTNPHVVFRPREKEKYKLRKKRQNDLDAYMKMKQLRIDFTKVRAMLELVQRREKLNHCMLDMQCDWFEQRVYEMIDTSALPRESDRLSHEEVEETLNVPKYFDTQNIIRGKKQQKRKRASAGGRGDTRTTPILHVGGNIGATSEYGHMNARNSTSNLPKRVVADQANPPSFLHPLATRETYATSWDNAVPFITSYVDSKPTPTSRFRHRPRIGRGGRVIIDRIPRPGNPHDPPVNVYTTGQGTQMQVADSKPATRMLDLLPEPLDSDVVRRRIEEISAAALVDDEERAIKSRVPSLPATANFLTPADDANNTEEVLVKLSEWIDTDEQIFGAEVGPPLGPV